MEKVKKSQMFQLLVIASLLMTTPLLSTSHRSKYLYFILNILILLVGAQSGLVSFFLDSSPPNNKIAFSDFSAADNHNDQKTSTSIIPTDTDHKVLGNRCSGKMNVGGVVKTPPTTPSIFFIEEDASFHYEDEREENEEEEIDEELLFEKAEMFIGNFYKQLKMQRKESWKKLHDIYHKQFNQLD